MGKSRVDGNIFSGDLCMVQGFQYYSDVDLSMVFHAMTDLCFTTQSICGPGGIGYMSYTWDEQTVLDSMERDIIPTLCYYRKSKQRNGGFNIEIPRR
jgi:hypothetical protein